MDKDIKNSTCYAFFIKISWNRVQAHNYFPRQLFFETVGWSDLMHSCIPYLFNPVLHEPVTVNQLFIQHAQEKKRQWAVGVTLITSMPNFKIKRFYPMLILTTAVPGATSYENSNAAQFPRVKYFFWEYLWSFSFDIFTRIMINCEGDSVKISKENNRTLLRNAVFYRNKFGNVPIFARRFSVEKPNIFVRFCNRGGSWPWCDEVFDPFRAKRHSFAVRGMCALWSFSRMNYQMSSSLHVFLCTTRLIKNGIVPFWKLIPLLRRASREENVHAEFLPLSMYVTQSFKSNRVQ